jgi:hypothetical protein
MTTALIGWLISAIDADSCPRNARLANANSASVSSRCGSLSLTGCAGALHSGSAATMSGGGFGWKRAGAAGAHGLMRSEIQSIVKEGLWGEDINSEIIAKPAMAGATNNGSPTAEF